MLPAADSGGIGEADTDGREEAVSSSPFSEMTSSISCVDEGTAGANRAEEATSFSQRTASASLNCA